MGKRLASFTSDIHGRRFDALSELQAQLLYRLAIFSELTKAEKVFSPREDINWSLYANRFFLSSRRWKAAVLKEKRERRKRAGKRHVERDYAADWCDEQRDAEGNRKRVKHDIRRIFINKYEMIISLVQRLRKLRTTSARSKRSVTGDFHIPSSRKDKRI